MIELTNTAVWGFSGAIRGMRNPYKTVSNGDSRWEDVGESEAHWVLTECYPCRTSDGFYDGALEFKLGRKDHELAMKLCKAGPEHRKFLRMIHCQVDIKAPLYWWKQFDTLKIGTTANSESTMHTITKKEFERSDFSFEAWGYDMVFIDSLIEELNFQLHNWEMETDPDEKKDIWKCIIQLLPESYNQTRTVDLNYEVIRTAYHQRKNHKLGEWHKFCEWAEQLPYSELITGEPDGMEDRS